MSKQMSKIILVDDEPMFLDIYRKALEKEYEIITADDGLQALGKIEKEKPDLVMVDIVMPKMDGIEMIKVLKEKKLNIPIIVLTNLIDEERIAQAISLGAKEYIDKNETVPSKILEKVQRVLNAR